MSHETDRKRYILPYLSQGNCNILMRLISPKLSDPARFRLHVLDTYYKYGKKSEDAFGIPKSTLYDWKRSYESSGKRPVSLVPKSTRPHKTRVMTTDYRLLNLLRQ